MFSKVFLIFALAFVASAYQIPYQGLEVPTYEKYQYGTYHPFLELIKSVVGSPYSQGYYKYPYYTPEEETGYVAPEGEYPYYGSYQYPYYYPQYVSSWLKYPYYYGKSFQQYSPISSYYQGQQDIPYYKYPGYSYPYYKYPFYPYSSGYQGGYPYSYGSSYSSYPLLSKILGSYYGYGSKYTGVPEYMAY